MILTTRENDHLPFRNLQSHNSALLLEVAILQKQNTGGSVEYTYHDGRDQVRWNSHKILSCFSSIAFDFDLLAELEAMRSQNKGRGWLLVVEKTRSLFSVKPLAEEGLMDRECLDLIKHFVAFCDKIRQEKREIERI
jgi:hypothetical protein